MGSGPLHIAFLWHMHQPYYKDLVTGSYAMPWVRLHGVKDYYDMVNILRGFPDVRQTFNLVPSLIDQIIDYGENDATGIYLEHAVKPADELTADEKAFVLKNFFFANWDNMIRPNQRYWELLAKRGHNVSEADIPRMARYFSSQDFLDLQVWFNLAWFDPYFRENDEVVRALAGKGRDFTEEEKLALLDKQREVMRLIIPEYKALWDAGQIEVSASPYYHPILPLLYDTDSAKMASPDINLPLRFSHPEDARAQIRLAVARFEEVFGRRPAGMWPSEGSVSEDIIPLAASEGIKWMASDEGVLASSLGTEFERDFSGISRTPELLYRPYRVGRDGSFVDIVFRDHTLSDLVGFVYSKWDPKNAVEDLMGRLSKVRRSMLTKGSGNADGLVTIALDGENAWEHYKNDGRDFLMRLYERLSGTDEFELTTIGGYLEKSGEPERLKTLFSGSWINHNFNIWIGHEEDNAAWDALSAARQALVDFEASGGGAAGADGETDVRLAWEEIYIAEGSDWCWWYGDDHSSENDREFDELFRKHLVNVYRLIGQEPPDALMIPLIRDDRRSLPTVELTAFISPTLDGEVTSYYEWLAAGYYDVSHAGGTMHRAESILSHIYFGFDLHNLFVRLDTTRELGVVAAGGLVFSVHFLRPKLMRVESRIDPESGIVTACTLEGSEGGGRAKSAELATIAADEVIEMAIPFERIGAKPDNEVNFFVTVWRDGEELEKWPHRGYISFRVPTEDFEAIMWHV